MKSLPVKRIGVIGLGRVGLPLALVLAESGYKVYGVDKDEKKVTILSKKKSPFLEEGISDLLSKHLNKNFLLTKVEDLAHCNVIIITVGTLLSQDLTPNISDVFRALDEILPYIKDASLLVLRSTVEPNATRKVKSYLRKKGKKLYLAYAPERLAEGFAVKELSSLPQIIGTFDKISAGISEEIFASFAPEIIQTDPLTAELAKLALNTYRYSTFAIANELMMISNHYGKDIHQVLEVANRNYARPTYSGSGIPIPGFAAGPCLVKDPFFMKYNTPFNTMITGSFMINDSLPNYFLDQLKKRTDIKGKKIAFLGLTFKKNVDDTRSSLATRFAELLIKEGAKVYSHDPFVKKTDLSAILKNVNILVLAIDHDEYRNLTLTKIRNLVSKNCLICDVWNLLGQKKIFFKISELQERN